MIRASTILAALLLAGAAHAQTAAPPPPPPAAVLPDARPADVGSPQAIVAATYDVISGPAGPRDWARFRSLFVPGARMTVAGVRPDGAVSLRTLSVDEYQARSGARLLKEGFAERGVKAETRVWAHTAVVRSLYETRHLPGDAKPFARGINTFVLVNDGSRWAIASLSWEAENAATPIPAGELGAP